MNLLAWPITFLTLVFMYPWVRWLLDSRANGESGVIPGVGAILTGLTTLGLSLGTLSLVMMWMGLLGLHIDWRTTVITCVAISAVGWTIRLRTAKEPQTSSAAGITGWWRGTILLTVIICGLILFNAAYWPFGIDDAITIYATFGKQIALTGQLPRGTLYELYPMLVPLSYAFTHQAAGWINEYLAALIPAALSIGVVGVAYLLGSFFNRATALTAALLVALTPMFTHWASAGYVDLPAGFFYGLSAFFLLRLDRTRSWRDALLAGIMAGLSAWTKNSALLIVISIAAWSVYHRWIWRIDTQRRISFRQISIIALGFVAVAGPWYLHNLVVAGTLVPPTGWTWKAEHTLGNLFPYIRDSRYFYTGWLFTLGTVLTLWQAWRSRDRRDLRIFLLVFYIPFFAIWWALVSYDDRFLLVLTPFVAVMGALVVQEIARRIPARWHRPALVGATIVVILIALPAAISAVDYKGELLRNPFMSDADKHRIRLGADRYDMALYLRTLPANSRIWTQDLLLPYHADGMQLTVGLAPTAEQLASFDYWIADPEHTPLDCPIVAVHKEGDYQLYRVADMIQNGQIVCPNLFGTLLRR